MIGLMSGSSLDGIDIAECTFTFSPQLKWSILKHQSFKIANEWKENLKSLPNASLSKFHSYQTSYGKYLGEIINSFTANIKHPIDAVALHGHTVMHDPINEFSIQFGSGSHIAKTCQVKVIDQFRAMDMAYGGQGAPLAHMADMDLFPGHDLYLNLGGIANLTTKNNKDIFTSFDVCGANQVLDRLAKENGKDFDKDGVIASNGTIHKGLLNNLLDHPFLKQAAPKSLDNQYTVQEFYNPFTRINLSVEDKLATATEFIVQAITREIDQIFKKESMSLFITGGGAFNKFLIRRFAELNQDKINIHLPSPDIIEFKESILMGYLGALRLMNKPNCRGVITGADKDTINGLIHLP